MSKQCLLGLNLASCIYCFLLVNAVEAESVMKGVADQERAAYNWVMHCRGCHGVDASGSKGGAPTMIGVVGRFMQDEEGRAFLGRVPGVAFAPLSDLEIADLLNWFVQEFDKPNMPESFLPYSVYNSYSDFGKNQ